MPLCFLELTLFEADAFLFLLVLVECFVASFLLDEDLVVDFLLLFPLFDVFVLLEDAGGLDTVGFDEFGFRLSRYIKIPTTTKIPMNIKNTRIFVRSMPVPVATIETGILAKVVSI